MQTTLALITCRTCKQPKHHKPVGYFIIGSNRKEQDKKEVWECCACHTRRVYGSTRVCPVNSREVEPIVNWAWMRTLTEAEMRKRESSLGLASDTNHH